MKYALKIVANDALPPDVARVLVERPGQGPLLIITERAAGGWRLVTGWENLADAGGRPQVHLRAVS